MYETFFGFRERPFDLTPNPRFLVLTESHQEVLSNLEYGITSRKGVTLVIGEAGSGKTTLIRTVLERYAGKVHGVHVSNPTLSRAEFVETLAAKFGLSDAARHSKAVMLAELEVLLTGRYERGEATVLIVDEAQSLSLELLEEIRLLANTETNQEKLLPVVLAGQPELAERLNSQELRQLKQRIALRCELRPLSDRETAGYIAGRISVAGGSAAKVFTREAVSLIHQAARGLPRIVSVLADNALLGGFAKQQKPVDSAIVRDVCRDFDLITTDRPVENTRRPAAIKADSILASVASAEPADRLEAGPLVTVPEVPGNGMFSVFTRRTRSFFGN